MELEARVQVKKLEIDRRRIKENITFLNRELEEIKKHRRNQRSQREESGIPKVALAGYTNVGKSSLRNLLASQYSVDSIKKEDIFVKNMLFATLDTTTRSVVLPNKRTISLTDTVGFIRKLPHDLIEAFKSTLEEVVFADLILHIVDASSLEAVEQVKAVEEVLKELDCENKKTILVLNKCDLATAEHLEKIKEEFKSYNIVEISVKEEYNIDSLMTAISDNLEYSTSECKFLIPYTDTAISALLHRNAVVLEEKFLDTGVEIRALVGAKEFNNCKEFLIED